MVLASTAYSAGRSLAVIVDGSTKPKSKFLEFLEFLELEPLLKLTAPITIPVIPTEAIFAIKCLFETLVK